MDLKGSVIHNCLVARKIVCICYICIIIVIVIYHRKTVQNYRHTNKITPIEINKFIYTHYQAVK